MQSQEMLEVAGLLAAQAPAIICDRPELPESSLADYWVASRCRLDSWGYDLRTYAVAAGKSNSRPFTPRLYRLAVEIETSEVLARTLAALGVAHDSVHQRRETSPITSNALMGLREAKVRLDAVLASREHAAFRDMTRFRSLRFRLHALTDRLVGCFLPLAPVAAFAHDAPEATRVGTLASGRMARGREPIDWPELLRLISHLRAECGAAGPNAEQNRRVVAAAMGLFDPEMFDSFGLLRTTWLRRLERMHRETSVLIEDWLAPGEGKTAANSSHRST